MKGLLIKDVYTMTREIKYLLALALIIVFIRNDFLLYFIIVYSTVLPVSSLAYDEQAKWNKLADMLPFTPSQLVGSKYLFALLSIAAATLFSVACRFLTSGASGYDIFMLLIAACIALLLEAIQLPIMFGLGPERGRILFIIVTVVIACSAYSIPEILNSIFTIQTDMSLIGLLSGAVAAVFLANLLSLQISKTLYRRRT